MGASPWQILIVLGLLILLFGGKRLPALGKSLGEGITNFRKGLKGSDKDSEEDEDSKETENKESNQQQQIHASQQQNSQLHGQNAANQSHHSPVVDVETKDGDKH